MIRRPPRSTRTDTLFPYTTLFRSEIVDQIGVGENIEVGVARPREHCAAARRRDPCLEVVAGHRLDAGGKRQIDRPPGDIGADTRCRPAARAGLDRAATHSAAQRRVGTEWGRTSHLRWPPDT